MRDQKKIAILGVAHPGHAASYTHSLLHLSNAEVVGVWDEDAARAQAFAKHFELPQVFDSSQAVLAHEEVDAVVVCSTTLQHTALVTAAAQAGKHVLCEKPIATTLSDAQTMVQACKTANVQLHIAFVCRFFPAIQRMRSMIAAGEIGQVLGAIGGNRGIPPLPSRYPNWITTWEEAGGGALMDHSVHVTDAMCHVLNTRATRVFAENGTLFNESLAVDDAALLMLNFANDAVGSVDPSWSIPEDHPLHYDFYLRIVGTEGALTFDDTRQAIRVTSRNRAAGERHYTQAQFGLNIDEALVKHFIKCLYEGFIESPAATGEDGLHALQIALAGYESARTGQPVEIAAEANQEPTA